MDWQGEAIILGVRKHGETSAILDVFSYDKGRHSGLVRGGISRKLRPVLQPGNTVLLEWRARMEDHLGYFTVEPVDLRAAQLLDDPLALSGLTAACSVARDVLPERQPFPHLYQAFGVLLDNLHDPEIWPAIMVRFELGLLEALGYGLDLKTCAASGRNDTLAYVSPRSGRAVSEAAGEPYRDKLFNLPRFLMGEPQVTPQDVHEGLRMTGFFLESRILHDINRPLPEARTRMLQRLVTEGFAKPRKSVEPIEI